MSILLTLIHIVACIMLVVIILLQTGKGAGMGAAFGAGGSQTLFGSSGGSSFMNRFTTGVAVVFMVTCLSLAYLSTHRKPASIMEGTPAATEQPASEEHSRPPAHENQSD